MRSGSARAPTGLVWALAFALSAASLVGGSSARGAMRPRGFVAANVRVIVGDTVEIWRRGGRLGVGLIGIDAPQGNTTCGIEAAAKLQRLVSGGARFLRERSIRFDERFRRMLYAYTSDDRSIAVKMVRAGFAYATGEGDERVRLRRAQASARRNGRGCLWRDGGTGRAVTTTLRDGFSRSEPEGTESRSIAAAVVADVPAGFVQGVVTSGLDLPTAFAFLPDGRVLVALKAGIVRVIEDGRLLSTPLIDISDRVNDYWDRGLIGIAADPNFASNGHVYLYYTYEDDPLDYEGTKTARLTRVTVSGNTASRSSETAILGSVVGNSCNDFADGADCIPTDGPGHSTGAIHFASDGTMFVTVGDGAHWNTVVDDALRAQDVDLLAGKVLHVTRSGQGVSSNPFWNGDPSANRSKVWALGLRNAYRFSLRPGDEMPFIGD
ncbi:MAG TPA: PQQ-dependent sugar dehydrogenase, partial [Actinomycetota bacterium]